MQPILDVIEQDNKKRKTRKFLSLVIGHGIKVLIPAVSSLAVFIAAKESQHLFHPALSAFVLMFGIIAPNVANLMLTMMSFDRTSEAGTFAKYYFPRFWERKFTEWTTLRELKKAEQEIISYLKQPLTDAQKTALKVTYIQHKDEINEWYQTLFERQTLQFGYSWDKEKSEKIQKLIIWGKIKGILETIENFSINQNLLNSRILDIYLSERDNLQLHKLNTSYCDNLLSSKLYLKLKDSDYRDIETAFKDNSFEVLDYLVTHNKNTLIDWSRIHQLFNDNYHNMDSNYHHQIRILTQLAKEQSSEIKNEHVLSSLNAEKKIHSAVTPLAHNLLHYTPTHYPHLWAQIKEQYSYINSHKTILSPDHTVGLSDWLDQTLPILIKSDAYLSQAKPRQQQKVSEELLAGLEYAKEFFEEIINSSENELIKTLTTHNKHMAMRKK